MLESVHSSHPGTGLPQAVCFQDGRDFVFGEGLGLHTLRHIKLFLPLAAMVIPNGVRVSESFLDRVRRDGNRFYEELTVSVLKQPLSNHWLRKRPPAKRIRHSVLGAGDVLDVEYIGSQLRYPLLVTGIQPWFCHGV